MRLRTSRIRKLRTCGCGFKNLEKSLRTCGCGLRKLKFGCGFADCGLKKKLAVPSTAFWLGASASLVLEATSLLLRKTLFKLSSTSKDRSTVVNRASFSTIAVKQFASFYWTALSIEKVLFKFDFSVLFKWCTYYV